MNNNDNNHQQQQHVVIIKLGGSSITDKSQFETSNPKALKQVYDIIVKSIHPSFLSSIDNMSDRNDHGDNDSQGNPNKKAKPAFISIHKAGSYAHYHAKAFVLQGEMYY